MTLKRTADSLMWMIYFLKINNGYFLVGVESKGKPIPLNKIKKLLRGNHILKPGITRGRGYVLMNKTVDVIYVSHYGICTEVFLGIFNEN